MTVQSLPWRDRIIYGLGKTPDLIKQSSFDGFILFYYSQVLGLPGTLAGLTMFLVICADAVWDPIAGTFSDGLKNARFGRRLTPMLYATPVAVLGFYLLFAPPSGLPTMLLFAWMLGAALLLRCTMTFYQIPYLTLQAELSDKTSVRGSLLILASLFRMVTEFTLFYVAFNIFFRATAAFPNGQQDPAAYPRYGLVMGLVMGVLMVACVATLYPMVRRMRTYAASAPRRVSGLFSTGLWRALLIDNAIFRALVFGIFTFAIATGLNNSFHLYLGTYLFQLNPKELGQWRQAINVGGFVALIVLVQWLVRRFEVKATFVTSMALYGVIEVACVTIFMLGLWPGAWPVIILLVTGNFLAGAVNASNMVTPALMCSIAADHHEHRTGEPQQGLMFGLVHFAQKAGTGVGSLITGVLLDVIKFPLGAPMHAVPQSTVAAMSWFYVFSILAASALAVFVFRGYRLRQDEHDKVIADLNRSRGVSPEPRAAE